MHLPLHNPRWALEMIKRSKGTSLIIDYNGTFEAPSSSQIHTSYFVLTEVFKSHLSRVKRLVLQSKFAMSNLRHGFSKPPHKQRMVGEGFAGLFPLAKQEAPFMEHLEIQVESSEENMLPNQMVLGFSKLEVLILEGCGMNWDIPCFSHLRTLYLSRIPGCLIPSMTQLLGILSQTPLIESLRVTEIRDLTSQGSISSIQDVVPVSLVHLGYIELTCDLPSSALFFDTVLFSSKASRIELEHTGFPPFTTLHDSESSIALMKRLALRIQNHIEGSLVKLMLREKMLCWFKSNLSQEPTTRVEIDLREHGESLIALGNAFWQSLKVEQLVHLEIEDFRLNKKAWMMFGNLPLLEELFVRSNECPLLEVLSRGLGVVQIGNTDVPPSFIALKRLITFGWTLQKPGSLAGETIGVQMLNCFRSRESVGLHLELISMEESGIIDNQILAELREIITEVYVDSSDWNSSLDSESEKETESNERETDSEGKCYQEYVH
ncbi:hypothetical protein C0992_003717 [Termitomyces sp. T32_za158]|nr:hypothetical protein C0992_003717 [Termitomyces sp. T32_za158]